MITGNTPARGSIVRLNTGRFPQSLIYQVQIREWDYATSPDKEPVAEYMVGAESLSQAIELATAMFASEHPDKDIKKYFVHTHSG